MKGFDEIGLTVGDWYHIDLDPRPRFWRHPILLFKWWGRKRQPKCYYRITGISKTEIRMQKK